MRDLKTKMELIHEVRLSRVSERFAEWRARSSNTAKNRTAARTKTACKSRVLLAPLLPFLSISATILFGLSRESRADYTCHSVQWRKHHQIEVHIDRSAVITFRSHSSRGRGCIHVQSVRENGNRAKWIRSFRKSAREEEGGWKRWGWYNATRQRRASYRSHRRAGHTKLTPSRLTNIFSSLCFLRDIANVGSHFGFVSLLHWRTHSEIRNRLLVCRSFNSSSILLDIKEAMAISRV